MSGCKVNVPVLGLDAHFIDYRTGENMLLICFDTMRTLIKHSTHYENILFVETYDTKIQRLMFMHACTACTCTDSGLLRCVFVDCVCVCVDVTNVIIIIIIIIESSHTFIFTHPPHSITDIRHPKRVIFFLIKRRAVIVLSNVTLLPAPTPLPH